MKLRTLIACVLLIGSSATLADPIAVSYEIGDYRTEGYSASWLHEATGCASTGPSGQTLYMCGAKTGVSGIINGLLDSGYLWITGGVLNVDGTDHDIRSGGFGNFDDLSAGQAYGMRVRGYGIFLFEPIAMGLGKPNFFDGDTMILWGQNRAAYRCALGEYCRNDRWGIDLYAKRVEVSEPTTLALFGIGLLGIGLLRRRRATTSQ